MKYVLWLICVSAAFAGGPKLQTQDLDLGSKIKGEKVTATVQFSNQGDQTLTIDEIKTPCGCTKVSLDKKTFAPGESGEFEVTIQTARLTGAYDKRLVMVSNDPASPKQGVRIQFELAEATTASVD